jgi:hypothetical protein
MRSSIADAPLVVSTDGTAGPYITVMTDQLKPVVQALQAQGIALEVDDNAVMLDGKPVLSVINLVHGADVDRVKETLDHLVAGWRGKNFDAGEAPTSHNELIVRFDDSDSAEVLRRLESAPTPGWIRQPEREERMRKMRTRRAGAYCFAKKFAAGLGEVAVWLETRGTKELYVSSIVALNARRSLTVEHYNQVLKDFEKSFIEPLTRGLKSRVFNYQAIVEPTLEDLLSTDSIRRLRAFSATANKAMPHHVDLNRWHVFIARTHLENSVIDPTFLSDWLQGEGWPESESRWLVEQFEIGRAVLSVYDEERAAR